MRKTREAQQAFQEDWLDLEHSRELKMISDLLDDHPELDELVAQDLRDASGAQGDSGANGFSAEQVLRAVIIKQMNGFSFRQLAFHIADSLSYRRFCLLGIMAKCPSKSALGAAIKALKSETLELIGRLIVLLACEMGIESGEAVRVDATVVNSNIHPPMDSWLLWDCVRALSRLMKYVRKIVGPEIKFRNRGKRAKRRHIAILNAKGKTKRIAPYTDLLAAAAETLAEALAIVDQLAEYSSVDLTQLREALQHFCGLTEKVIDQTKRRVFDGETVPASDKIVSIFEEHTDIIIKDRRNTFFGHKICLTGGPSSVILDCVICEGNPADSELTQEMIDRQCEIFGQVPSQAAFDGGFASKDNLEILKEKGVEDVAFSKRRGMAISDMVSSTLVYRRLRDFRAGIEGNISFLKRIFGLDLCTWKSLQSFKSYVWSSIISFNLLVIARHLLA